jgi:hypothetical protein
VTNYSRLTDHKNKLWNWMRPFLCCPCNWYNSESCQGELLWFDHAIWFMFNHLEQLFSAQSLQDRLVLLIQYLLVDACKLACDQLGFIHI